MYHVLKFGGSSVAGATQMSRVLDILEGPASRGKVVLVASAISGATDILLEAHPEKVEALKQRHMEIARRLFTGAERTRVQKQLEALFRELDQAPQQEKVTYGELLSTHLLAWKLQADGVQAVWLDSRKLIIKGDPRRTNAAIQTAVQEAPDAQVYVAPGFICGTPEGGVSTLGRGGSDYSAAIYAAALKADSLQIWTDVPGIMTANPKQVPQARTIPHLSYGAALDMAQHGAKVLYAPTVQPAMEAGIDIEIRNTFAPEGKYTVIGAAPDPAGWIGLASQGAVIRLVAAQAQTQAQTQAQAPTQAPAMALKQAAEALQSEGIAALDMQASDGGLDITVRETVLDQAMRALHRTFFQQLPVKDIPLFIAGNGAVAKALIQIVNNSREEVARRTGKNLRIVGMANSRQYGIAPAGSPQLTQEGSYVDAVLQAAPKGSLFIDCTNSETLYKRYTDLLQAGIGIVSSNRRSFAVPYAEYAAMHAAARENGVALRYETTVGAALPVLDSIAMGARSSNELLSLEAVVSCTLNQILADYRPGGESFASMVRRAQEQGLTEADPRLDLGGRDALRKLLILARVAGVHLEEADVKVDPVVPEDLFQGSVEDFYRQLKAYEPQWAQAVRKAENLGFRRRFVASLEKTADGFTAVIGLRNVAPVHPAYHLRGTENAIIVRSAFHPYPLVIQGPGEGALEAASSLLNDILR